MNFPQTKMNGGDYGGNKLIGSNRQAAQIQESLNNSLGSYTYEENGFLDGSLLNNSMFNNMGEQRSVTTGGYTGNIYN